MQPSAASVQQFSQKKSKKARKKCCPFENITNFVPEICVFVTKI